MEIKYTETKEEIMSRLDREIKKDERTTYILFCIKIINLILVGFFAYFNINTFVVFGIILFTIIHLVSLFSGAWGSDNPYARRFVLEKIMDLNDNQKILDMTFIETENPYISYRYEDEEKILEDYFYVDKTENRIDIEEDTLFLGSEIVFAKKEK